MIYLCIFSFFFRYVLFVRKNALQILIPKFGLEGTVFLNALKDDQKKKTNGVVFTFNEEVSWPNFFLWVYNKFILNFVVFPSQDYTQRCGDVVFHAFDPVIVRLSIDSSNVQHEKLVFQLVKPYIKGFSVELDENAEIEESKDVEMASTAPPKKKVKKSKQNKNK